MSLTKNMLVTLMKQEIDALQVDVMAMNEDSLLKQLAKRKVVYNLTKEGSMELVYSYLALSEHYIQQGLHGVALINLHASRALEEVGDSSYLIGVILFHQNQFDQALTYLEASLNQQWIEPSIQHQIANKLQCMTYIQKILFQFGHKDQLIQLSNRKIQLTRQQHKLSQAYFQALSLADLFTIYMAFGQKEIALQKISQSISTLFLIEDILENSNEDPSKLIELLLAQAKLQTELKSGKKSKCLYEKAKKLVEKYPGCVEERIEAEIYECLIKEYIFS